MNQISKLQPILAIIIPFFVASYLFIFFSKNLSKENAEDLGLGKQTSSYYSTVNNLKIHCNDSDIHECIDIYKQNKKKVSLWLGNSQLHGINQMKEGDISASEILYKKLYPNVNLLTVSMGNASLIEKKILIDSLTKTIAIDRIIIPIVMDDMREGNVRPSIKNFSENRSAPTNSAIQNSDLDALDDTFQKKSERYFNTVMGNIFPSWNLRGEMRTEIFFGLYALRNEIFNVNASSKRPMIKGIYKQNMDALKDTLQSMNENEIKTIIYIVPIRSDVSIPYLESEYLAFKKEIINLSKIYDVEVFNFENIVEPDAWGAKNSTNLDNSIEIDFMHFQAEGHQALANSLYPILAKPKD